MSAATTRTSLVFVSGIAVGLGIAYHFAIRPLTLGAELSAQAGFMLLRDRMRDRSKEPGAGDTAA